MYMYIYYVTLYIWTSRRLICVKQRGMVISSSFWLPICRTLPQYLWLHMLKRSAVSTFYPSTHVCVVNFTLLFLVHLRFKRTVSCTNWNKHMYFKKPNNNCGLYDLQFGNKHICMEWNEILYTPNTQDVCVCVSCISLKKRFKLHRMCSNSKTVIRQRCKVNPIEQ